MKDINNIQEEIITEFEPILEFGDREILDDHIWDLGKTLLPMEESEKTDQNIIKGCQSVVYLTAKEENGKIYYAADSNTGFTKGVISLLVRVLSGKQPDEIINAELYFIDKIGLRKFLSSQRSNGLTAMIKQMKLYAIAYKEKVKQNS